jgi:type I restriction enzyme S subunit
VNDYNDENVISIGRVGAYCGSLHRELNKCWISDNAISAKSKIECNMYCYYTLSDLNLNERSEGTGQPLITQGMLNAIEVVIPKTEIILQFENFVSKIYKHENLLNQETQKLQALQSLLLAKMASIENNRVFTGRNTNAVTI